MGYDGHDTKYLQKILSSCGQDDCTACKRIKHELTKRGQDMSYAYDNGNNALVNKVEKYVVLTTGGAFQGSWVAEADALFYIKTNLKNKNNTNRYLILECQKEVGTKSPEIEIEEYK